MRDTRGVKPPGRRSSPSCSQCASGDGGGLGADGPGPESPRGAAVADEDDEPLQLEDLVPSPDAGPEALYARNLLLDELELAVDELPAEQREVFVAHELEGRSFKEMSAETGVSVNTLLSRKRYAVLHLRERLRAIHDEFTKP